MSTLISWSDETWNCVTGCDRVSPGCSGCYAMAMAARLKAMGSPRYQKDGGRASGPGFGVTLHPDKLEEPLHWKKPKRIFVNSMSDLFHEDIPNAYIDRIFAVMALCPQHTFQVLTKRIERALLYLNAKEITHSEVLDAAGEWSGGFEPLEPSMSWPLPNVLIGPTVENQHFADVRLPVLAQIHALGWRTMVSFEPLLQPIEVSHWLPVAVDWAIVGAESGPKRRPFDLDWARSLQEQCQVSGTPFFFKQTSALRSESLEGVSTDLLVRQFP